MQKLNRLISVILILSMLLSSFPMAAIAQDVSERDLIDRTQNLGDDHARRKDRSAMQIVLLIRFPQAALLLTNGT